MNHLPVPLFQFQTFQVHTFLLQSNPKVYRSGSYSAQKQIELIVKGIKAIILCSHFNIELDKDRIEWGSPHSIRLHLHFYKLNNTAIPEIILTQYEIDTLRKECINLLFALK